MPQTKVPDELKQLRRGIMRAVRAEARFRAREGSQELRRAAIQVLGGHRSGRMYRSSPVRGTRYNYRASQPGEPPAVRSGRFRRSWFWRPRGQRISIQNRRTPHLARFMSQGVTRQKKGGKLEPRPFDEAIKAQAWEGIKRIYTRPWLRGSGHGDT